MAIDYTALFTGLFVGLLVGIIAMAVISDRGNKAYIESLNKEIEINDKNHHAAISSLEGQVQELEYKISVLRKMNKKLSENNKRLRKCIHKKADNEPREQ